jgi:hypothetical protein
VASLFEPAKDPPDRPLVELGLAGEGADARPRVGAVVGRVVGDFDLLERADLPAAQVAAMRLECGVVTEALQLVGILEQPSNTQQKLVARAWQELANKAKKEACACAARDLLR